MLIMSAHLSVPISIMHVAVAPHLEDQRAAIAGGEVADGHLAVVLQRPAVGEDVAHARGDLVPRVVVADLGQFDVQRALAGELHRLAPKLGAGPLVLVEYEAGAFCVRCNDGRVVAHLFRNKPTTWRSYNTRNAVIAWR